MLLKLTSAIIKPFSKSLWIFPAACGALVPFWEGGREREREREREMIISTQRNLVDLVYRARPTMIVHALTSS